MNIRVLVPLYRLDVDYLVRHGRRWSALEHLILWACGEPTTATELGARTGMPVRLVSECLVNLLRPGWVEFRASPAGNFFAATEAGKAAAAKPLPDQLLETQRRSTQVFMDRLSGEFFGIREVTVMRRDTPGFRPEEVLVPNLFSASPFGPELVDRLPLGDDDTFERLREKPQLIPGELFAVVEVAKDGFDGLPARTPASVGMAIFNALQDRKPAGAPGGDVLPRDEAVFGAPLQQRGQSVPITFGPGTLLVGGQAHLAAALEAITEARRIIVIHSTFVGRNIEGLLPALGNAAASGVQLYLHWGRNDDPEGIEANPSEIAARLALGKIPPEHRNNIHLGERSTGSHAKIILADRGKDDSFCAIVGSCNWLDSPFESVEASVRLFDSAAIAQIAGKLASILVPAVGHDLVVSRLLDIHGECAARPRPRSKYAALLVVDEDHYAAVRDAMVETADGGTVLLGSHKFGHAGETTVFDPMRAAARHGARVRLFYTKVLPNFGQAAAVEKEANLAKEEIQLRRAGEAMHAKFLGWREKLLVTSFNFLSASVNGRHRSGAEIGVLLTGPGIVEDFESTLATHNVTSEYRASRRRRRRKPSPNKTSLHLAALGNR